MGNISLIKTKKMETSSKVVAVRDCIISLNKGVHLSLESIKQAYCADEDVACKAETYFKEVLAHCVSKCAISKIKNEVALLGVSIRELGFLNGAEIHEILQRIYDTGGDIPSLPHVTLGVLTVEEALLAGLSKSFDDLPEGRSVILGMHPVTRMLNRRRHGYLFKLTKQNDCLVSQAIPLKTTSGNIFPPATTVLFAVRNIDTSTFLPKKGKRKKSIKMLSL